jgi:hypothetical protein
MRAKNFLKSCGIIFPFSIFPYALTNGEHIQNNIVCPELTLSVYPDTVSQGGLLFLEAGDDWLWVDTVIWDAQDTIPVSLDPLNKYSYWMIPVHRSATLGWHKYVVTTPDSTYTDSVYVTDGRFGAWPSASTPIVKSQERIDRSKRNDSVVATMYDFVSVQQRLWSQPFVRPTKNLRIKDRYGTLRETFTNAPPRYHYGVDYAPTVQGKIGEPVLSMNDGIVMKVDFDSEVYGNYIVVDHGGGIVLSYFHNDSVLVSVGQFVKRGEVIARMGGTGKGLTGPHVHVDAKLHGVQINPLILMMMSEKCFQDTVLIEPSSMN